MGTADEQIRVSEPVNREDEVGPQGPFPSGTDALIAAVGRELDAPVGSDDDLTHRGTKRIVDVEEY